MKVYIMTQTLSFLSDSIIDILGNDWSFPEDVNLGCIKAEDDECHIAQLDGESTDYYNNIFVNLTEIDDDIRVNITIESLANYDGDSADYPFHEEDDEFYIPCFNVDNNIEAIASIRLFKKHYEKLLKSFYHNERGWL